MRLLDRYLLRELLIPLGYCLSGFIIFFCAFDLIFNLHKFQENKMTPWDCVEYYQVTLPEVFVMIVAPVSLLLALLYAITTHARHNEFTAIRAAGVSLWRISLPYLAVGILFSGVVFYVNEFWAPQAQDKAEEIMNRRVGASQSASSQIFDLRFYNAPENRSWYIRIYNKNTTEMRTVVVNWELPDGSLRNIYAKSGVYTNGNWLFRNVEEIDYKSKLDPVPLCKTNATFIPPFSETPEMIKSQIKFNQINLKRSKKPRMSMSEISDYMRLNPKLSPGDQKVMTTQWQCRIAEPLKCLMVVLIAIPFGARSGRRNVFVGVASSIVIFFSYYILQQLSQTLGMNGKIPGFWAAWTPNMVFGMTGIILILRVR